MSISSNDSSGFSSLSDNTIYGSIDDTDEIDRIKNLVDIKLHVAKMIDAFK